MSRVQIFKMEKEKSIIVHKIIGVIFIFLGILLLLEYFIHFLKITIAVICLFAGFYFLTKETRFRWFRIRRF